MAHKPASVNKFLKSAPLNPSLIITILLKSTLLSKFIFLAWIFKISYLPVESGKEIYIFLEILPGLKKAGSSDYGLFVQNTHFT